MAVAKKEFEDYQKSNGTVTENQMKNALVARGEISVKILLNSAWIKHSSRCMFVGLCESLDSLKPYKETSVSGKDSLAQRNICD